MQLAEWHNQRRLPCQVLGRAQQTRAGGAQASIPGEVGAEALRARVAAAPRGAPAVQRVALGAGRLSDGARPGLVILLRERPALGAARLLWSLQRCSAWH